MLPDFEDFILEGGWDLLFSEGEGKDYRCPHCRYVIKGSEEVRWIDKLKGILYFPECDGKIELKDK